MTERLFRPVDIAPLVFFRIVGGGLIAIECAGHALTQFRQPYVDASFYLSWSLTPWLAPGPPLAVYMHMAANVLAALLVVLGCFYRVATVCLAIGIGLLLGMEQTAYINHTYLYALYAAIFACIPANAAVSLDARWRPQITRNTAPAWCLHLLRFQIAVVYVFAGLAKLDADWLHAMPLSMWLRMDAWYPLIGPVLAAPVTAYVMSYGGLVFDLLVVPAMLWARTRRSAFLIATAFHLTNVVTFGIGTFPWFSLAATALFFPPRSFHKLPLLASRLAAASRAMPRPPSLPGPACRRLVVAALAAYACVQIAIPSRRFFIAGNPSWTEIGHTFAWRMMLRQKQGRLTLRLHEPATGRRWKESAAKYLTSRQLRDVVGDPEMILQLARHVADRYTKKGRKVEVRADAFVSLNGRARQRLVRADVDLACEQPRLDTFDIVLPFDERPPPP
jgi:vitamin K-dependent gamma-carboxylase